jgi:hypothetical protein
MSLLQFHMLAYEFLKLEEELLIIIFIISIVIVGTRCGVVIFFSQVNSCFAKIGYSGLVNRTIQFF